MKIDLKKKLKKIKFFIMDVDGVLTNGKINIDSHGNELKVYDVKDGQGISLLKKANIKTAIISARSSQSVIERAQGLKIDKVYQDAFPKTNAYEKLLNEFNFKDEDVCFIGDDLPDLCLFRRVGLAVAVRNASYEAKKEAHYVTVRNGGDGAIREIVEMILKAQEKWKNLIKNY